MRAEGERVAADLWQKAFEHPDHLCNGLCPDESYMNSRDPECFYCSVMTLANRVKALEAALERYWAGDDDALLETRALAAPQPPLARDPEWPLVEEC